MAEYERLNREKFTILDKILAARPKALLKKAQVAEQTRKQALTEH
jgi:hypothetical protein